MKDDKKKWMESALDYIAGGLFGEAYKAKKKRREQLKQAGNAK